MAGCVEKNSIYALWVLKDGSKYCETAQGDRFWYDSDNRPHRDDDLPAVMWRTGSCSWLSHGVACRAGGLPSTIRANGDRAYTSPCGDITRIECSSDGTAVTVGPDGLPLLSAMVVEDRPHPNAAHYAKWIKDKNIGKDQLFIFEKQPPNYFMKEE